IGVVMAAPSNGYRDREMAGMLDDGFAQELGGSAKLAALQAAQAARQAQDQSPVVPATAPLTTANPRAVAANGGYGGRSGWSLDLGTYTSKAAAFTAVAI